MFAPMKMLTATEVSTILRVSRDTVRRMIERGDLAGFQRGKITRVTLESVEELVGERQRPGESDAVLGADGEERR